MIGGGVVVTAPHSPPGEGSFVARTPGILAVGLAGLNPALLIPRAIYSRSRFQEIGDIFRTGCVETKEPSSASRGIKAH